MKRLRALVAAAGGLTLATIAACGVEHVLVDVFDEGTYRVSFGAYPPAERARFEAVTARLDRAAGQVVFTMADGSQQVLAFTPRPRGEWRADCYTMASHHLVEVADLSPAPLQIESLTFETPLVFAMCSRTRMILANALPDPDLGSVHLGLDLE